VPVCVLGEGGMGTVYLARQQQPIRREVALKVVKLRMDSRQVLERFEIERQALALMDYPNIPRVLDAGTSERGRPYFVMEYVNGVPITQYCDGKALSTDSGYSCLFQSARHYSMRTKRASSTATSSLRMS
jgi:serine/threonine protein kinase